MLITNLRPITTALAKIKEVPDIFFANLEAAETFNNNLFPKWLTDKKGKPIVFGKRTELRNRFKAIYDKYKAIGDVAARQRIISAYFDTNKVSALCNNEDHLSCFELNDLHENIRKEIDDAFLYLYTSALNHPAYETFVKSTIKVSLWNFTNVNGIDVCPFCGLEMLLQIEGQARLPLDHWLNKDKFPFAAINFENLIPIGTDCNSNGVKGVKNVLKDIRVRPKKRAFYPYILNKGFGVSIVCTKNPNVENEFGEWEFSIAPNDASEKDYFESWNFIFNISTRYKSYFDDKIVLNWRNRYVEFLQNNEDDVNVVHAASVEQFKENLRYWKRTFMIRRIPAAKIYIGFIDYLINEAPDDYLYGEVESFKSKVIAGVI